MTYQVLQKSTGNILEFRDERHYLDWFDWTACPFDVGDGLFIDLERGEKGVELKQRECPVEQPKIVKQGKRATFVINETQTHYTLIGDDEEKYTQCLTCKKLNIEYESISRSLGCTERYIPTLPVCDFKEASGLTLKRLYVKNDDKS